MRLSRRTKFWVSVILTWVVVAVLTEQVIVGNLQRLLSIDTMQVAALLIPVCIVMLLSLIPSSMKIDHYDRFVIGDTASTYQMQQPNLLLGLTAGETLTLHRKLTDSGVQGARRMHFFAIFVTLMTCALPLIGGFYAFSIFSGAVGLFIARSEIIGLFDRGDQTIVADDSGITIRRKNFRTRHMDWGEIQGIVRENRTGITMNTTNSNYTLISQDRYLPLNFIDPAIIILGIRIRGIENAPKADTPRVIYMYTGGNERYFADVERLLATLVARTHLPIRSARTARKPNPVAEDIPSMPLAPAHLQPQSFLLPMAENVDMPFQFGQRLPLARLVLTNIILSILVSCCPILLLDTTIAQQFSAAQDTSLFSQLSLDWVGLLMYSAFFFFIFFLTHLAFYRRHNPRILLTREGMAIRHVIIFRKKRKPRYIAWERFQAWSIDTSAQKRVGYTLFTKSGTLRWSEPTRFPFDRREAYQKRAAQLHALIAHYTHLPLHEIRAEANDSTAFPQ